MKATLILWLVSAMLRWTLPEAQHDAAKTRYAEIANDAVAVAFDPAEKPIFSGPLGRTKTAALLLSIASFESGFAKDVDEGTRRGDGGRSWCLMQVNLGSARIRVEDQETFAYSFDGKTGWSGKDLADDRKKCFRAALRIARVSYRACGDLSVYTSGKCAKDEPKAKAREARAKARFLDLTPLTWLDSDILDPRTLASNP